MAYIDVIPLDDAKAYLRLDSGITNDDAYITRLISAALRYIETETNILVYQRSKTYLMVDGSVIVYDYPVSAVTVPTDYDDDETEEKTLYSTYNYGSETTDLTLTVGYLLPADVPEDLIEVALEIIDIWYYKDKTGKTLGDLSEQSKRTLSQNKRFII